MNRTKQQCLIKIIIISQKKKNSKIAIQYIAKLNVPLLPKKKQVVLGTTKYLLPYFCLPDYFNVFALDPKDWTIDKNNRLIHTIVSLNEPIIRLITKPEHLIHEDGTLRVTGTELCILFHDYEIYKLNAGIYFLIKKGNEIKIEQDNLIVVDKNVVLYI